MVLKLLIVSFIIVVALTDINKQLRIPSKKTIDIILLGASVIVLFFDFHLGLLLTIAVMIFILQTNQSIIEGAQEKWRETYQEKPHPRSVVVSSCAPSDDYGNEKKQEVSRDILEYTLDDKVKPYEIYVKMITTKEHLENASNSAFLHKGTATNIL